MEPSYWNDGGMKTTKNRLTVLLLIVSSLRNTSTSQSWTRVGWCERWTTWSWAHIYNGNLKRQKQRMSFRRLSITIREKGKYTPDGNSFFILASMALVGVNWAVVMHWQSRWRRGRTASGRPPIREGDASFNSPISALISVSTSRIWELRAIPNRQKSTSRALGTVTEPTTRFV